MNGKLLFILLLLILSTSSMFAQDSETNLANKKEELTFNVQGIISFPSINFGTLSDNTTTITMRNGFKTGDKIGMAKTGFGVGFELNTPVWTRGMTWVISLKGIINPTSSEEIQSIYRSRWGDSVNVNLDLGNWINIPLMTGLKYTLDIFNDFALYGLVQGGVNFSKPPNLKATDGDITIEETNYQFITDYSVELGLGLVYNSKFILGFNYFNGGTPRYKGTRELNPVYLPGIFNLKNDIIAEERSISMFTVVLGIFL